MIRQVPWRVLAWGAALALIDGPATATVAKDGTSAITVNVANPLDQARKSETVVLHLDDLRRLVPALDPATTIVAEGSGAEHPSQLLDMNGDGVADDLVFQDDFAPRARKTFTVRAGRLHQPSREDHRVYGRFVRERHDDFAWENDRLAHRMDGRDLETSAQQPLTSSGVDGWTKRVRKLMVNDWYCAILVPGATADYKATDADHLLVTAVSTTGTLVDFAGFAWDRSPDVADAAAWAALVENKRREAAAPLHIVVAPTASTQSQATRMVESVIARAPAVLTDKWTYDTGMVLRGIERVALKTENVAALDYIKRTIDGLIDASGTIKGYCIDDYNIDQINMGRVLFRLWAEAQGKDKTRYRQALETLRAQMRTHPRTGDGAFWHKKIYPHQVWLDGVYMASPFLAEYAATFHDPELFDDIAMQIVLAERYMRDAKTGLLYHGWDENKKERWADPKTGRSMQFWGRAMGWYAMAVVDVLEWLPQAHPQRQAVLGVLGRLASAIAHVQDRATGVWWQVLDQPGRPENYREASASSMFVYALSKAIHNGWLDKAAYSRVASRGYQGLLAEFVELRSDGQLDLKNVCKEAGLGGKPYRDGSYAYYTSTEVVKNDPKGIGAFILAALENE